MSEATCWSTQGKESAERVSFLNCRLQGWANYFWLGSVSRSYRAVDRHVRDRLRRWLCRKHKISRQGRTRFPNQYHLEKLALISLVDFARSLPWA
ncbi:hypothetical protein KZZ20_06670 [Methylacidiphilum fumariolicum]|uniref:group II intron maturase-specific domain-containing protein n=1 Tax=Candidatus Methylacidiphilum fumarolicum TaxID=591154 RepID=UPI001ABCAAD6|nr:hypothetical protein [Candidatus Methylacidiphilum fumarolicum]